VVVPALVYLALTAGAPGTRSGWAIPVATDIAFALAVLAVIGSHLPRSMRTFLLTLAVVDDLIAITIIAFFYTHGLSSAPLLAAAVPLAAIAVLTRRRVLAWWLLIPLGLLTWGLVHASGVHATVAGVLVAVVLPVRARTGEPEAPAARIEHLVRPFSAGVAVPLFALAAAGVSVSGGGLGDALADPVFAAVVVALVAGKPVGVLVGTWLVARFTRAELDDGLRWSDVAGIGLLAGVGFTVSLLIGELAFGVGSNRDDHVRLAVLAGSLLSAGLAALVLRSRNTTHRASSPGPGVVRPGDRQ
jgi:NhaA family Na+:H+ antiporter